MPIRIPLSFFFLLIFSFLAIGALNFSGTFFPRPLPDPTDSLRKKHRIWHQKLPMERAWLVTDKPVYNPGETLWFSVFLAEEQQLTRPSLSEILYVEIVNPKGSVEKTLSLIARGGKANGDFQIPEDAPGGIYKLKTYTRWMQHFGREVVREVQVQELILPQVKLTLELDRQAYKSGDPVHARLEAISLNNQPLTGASLEISVLAGSQTLLEQTNTTDAEGKAALTFNLPQVPPGTSPVLNVVVRKGEEMESIVRPVPMVEKDLLVYFFPEGGDFIQNQTSRMAFRVLKPDSTSADAEGWLVNQVGERISYVKTLHRGMGSVEFRPKSGDQYRIEWKSPIEYSSPLPEPLEKGYALSARIGKGEVILKASSPEAGSLFLVAEMRGRWLWSKSLPVAAGVKLVQVPTKGWPAGVVKFSLFDGRQLLRCERLAFVNPEKQLKIKLKTDKERYQNRDKVDLSIRATDPSGLPVPAQVTVAVVNDALLNYAADKQGNLVSGWLLEQDLASKLEDPGFYFSEDPKAAAALDLVMLTFGWRGLKWKQMLEDNPEDPGFKPERAVLGGTLINSMDNKPLRDGKLEIGKRVVYSDSNGNFRFPFVDLSKPARIRISKGKGPVEEQTILRYSDALLLYYNPYPVVFDKRIPVAALNQNNGVAELAMAAAPVEADKLQKARQMPGGNLRKVAPRPAGAQRKAVADQGAPVPPRFKREEMILPDRPLPVEESPYYLSRSFPKMPAPKGKERTDFRTTLFWSGIVDLDANGRGSVSFRTNDEIGSFRAFAQGLGPEGMPGIGQALFYTELPFSISAKIPVEASLGDQVRLAVSVRNRTQAEQTFQLSDSLGREWKVSEHLPQTLTLKPMEVKMLLLTMEAIRAGDSTRIRLQVKSGLESDVWQKTIRIVPRGYPVQVSVSGREMTKYFNAEIRNLISGSLEVHATAYPDVTSDLLAGVESILAEPFGCFEQTSMTSYPNVLVLNYLRQSSRPDPALVSKSEALLEKGYKRLTSFETKQKGYEWFGGTPAHEALTAYGLMQFKEMQKLAPQTVDAGMFDRTANWLLSRRDGKGGFLRSAQALDNFGRASDDITNAYIVYSLAEAGFQQLDQEIRKTTQTALDKKDPYLLALASNTLWLLGQSEKAREVTRVLLGLQAGDGSWTGLTHSVTYSTGQALSVETTGFAILALIRSNEPDKAILDKAVQFLCQQRNGRGGFGNSQATIVALKALTSYVVFSKTASEDGAFTLEVNGKEAAKADWKAGTRKAITVTGWEKELKEGQNRLEFRYSVLRDPLPFTVGISYFTSLPPSDPACQVDLTTRLSASKTDLGKPVQMEIQLVNKTASGLPMTMASVSIPAGCVVPPAQFRELVESRKVDFYELKGNKIFLYYRQMAPSETRKLVVTLSPVIRGNFTSSASSAYLYYTAERKIWAEGTPLEIR